MTLDNGYETKTTFWSDFTIAEHFGPNAIKDTFERAFNEWKSNVEYITELSIVMNLKCWMWYDKEDFKLSSLYADLYYKVHYWCLDNLKGDDFDYYFHTTD